MGSDSKESACNAGNLGSIPGSGRSSGEQKGYQFQYYCLENSMDRGAWRVRAQTAVPRRRLSRAPQPSVRDTVPGGGAADGHVRYSRGEERTGSQVSVVD